MTDKKELQRKYVQFQILKQQMAAFLEEKVNLDNKTNEIRSTIEALSKTSEMKKGEDMWSPLGSGVFIRSDVRDNEKVLINIGADVFAVKPVTEAAEILRSRLGELERFDAEMMAEIEKLAKQAAKLEPELQKLAEAAEDGKG